MRHVAHPWGCIWGNMSMPRFASIANRLLPVLVSLALLAVAEPASANRLQLKDMIAQTGVQRTMVWTLSADIMRLALKIDEQGAVGRLRYSHGQFGPSLEFLRQGVSELQDRDVANADAMFVAITDVTRKWGAVDEALQPVWNAGTITVAQARELLDLNRRLGQSIEQILTHFEQASNHYGVVTVIGRAIMTTERGRALGQRITAEAMAVALDFDAGDGIPAGRSGSAIRRPSARSAAWRSGAGLDPASNRRLAPETVRGRGHLATNGAPSGNGRRGRLADPGISRQLRVVERASACRTRHGQRATRRFGSRRQSKRYPVTRASAGPSENAVDPVLVANPKRRHCGAFRIGVEMSLRWRRADGGTILFRNIVRDALQHMVEGGRRTQERRRMPSDRPELLWLPSFGGGAGR